MKKSSLLLLCVAVISPLGAAESTPHLPAAPAVPALPAAPAAVVAPVVPAAVAVSPAQLELARQVIKATQFDRLFDQMGAQMQQMAAQSMGLSAATLSPAKKEAAMKSMGEVMKLSLEAAKSMLEKVDGIFAEVYSEAELKAMLAFYESAEGKSMLQKQPQIMQHMRPLVMSMQQELMPKIQQIVEKGKADVAAAEAAEAAAAKPAPAPEPAPAPAVQK